MNRFNDLLEILDFDLTTDDPMTTDEILVFLGCTVDDDCEIIDSDCNYTGVFFDEID